MNKIVDDTYDAVVATGHLHFGDEDEDDNALLSTPSLFRWDNGGGEGEGAAGDNMNTQASKKPIRRKDAVLEGQSDRPKFLSDQTVGPNRPPPPRRRPPARTKGFRQERQDPVKMMKEMDLHRIPVKPLTFDSDTTGNGILVKEGIVRVLQDIVVDTNTVDSANEKNTVTIVFCIRVPGCGQCREHGIQLSEYLTERRRQEQYDTHDNAAVKIKGIIKETGVDDAALMEFYSDYFNFPLYKDEGMHLYNMIGNEPLDTWTLLHVGKRMHARVDAKGIRGSPNVQGEGLTQGGVLIFDGQGQLRYVYYETFGHELDMDAIHWAVEEAAKSQQ